MNERLIAASDTDVVRRGDGGGAWLPALALAILPVAFLLDFLRPAVLERTLIRDIALARGAEEPALDTLDYGLLVLMGVALATLVVLAIKRQRRFLIKLSLLAWSIAGPLILVEAVVTVMEEPSVFRPGTKRTYLPDPEILPGVSGPGLFTTNRRGMRGPEWDEDAYKILCVGGSTTICTYLDDSESWPAQLMTLLNKRQTDRRYWVGNVGKSGHATYHHIALLERLRDAAAVDCCLILCGVNDFEHVVRAPEDVRRRLAPSHVFEVGGAMDPTRPYLKQTHAYRWAKALLSHTAARDLMEVEDTGGKAYVYRRQLRQAATKDLPLPALEAPLAAYRKDLGRILALCRQRGVRCIFMTQPTMWKETMPPDQDALLWSRPVAGTGRALSTADLTKGMAAFNRTMKDFCQTNSVECIDLAAACPKDTTVFVDDAHFNEAGARLVARVVADHLMGTRRAEAKVASQPAPSDRP